LGKFQLIIFDCDGVPVDSGKIANEVFAEILNRECGLSLALAGMFEKFAGHSSQQCTNILQVMPGREPPEGIENRYKHEIDLAPGAKVAAVKAIEDVLRTLTVPFCVSSGGSLGTMQTTLGRTGLLPRLKALCSVPQR